MRQEYKRMMDQVAPSPALEARVLELAGKSGAAEKTRAIHGKKLFLCLAAALVLLTGSALAAADRLGVLDVFFRGDTSRLEPYVQTAISTAENGDYRLTVDSCYYDGQNVFAVITVEGLNEQAAVDLKSNRVLAETHREYWGEEMVQQLLEDGGAGPDTFCLMTPEFSADEDNDTPAAGSLGSSELPPPSENSRSWQLQIQFPDFMGELEQPLGIYLDFMGKDCAVYVPLDRVAEPIRITPNEEVVTNVYSGWKGLLTEFTLSSTAYSVEKEPVGDWKYKRECGVFGELEASDLFFLRMKDGAVLTRNQLGTINRTFENPVDLSQVASIIYGYTEFPVDGSPSFPANLDEHLYPFDCRAYTKYSHYYYISVDELCRGLGAEYIWNEETQTATASYRGVTLEMTAGVSEIVTNGTVQAMTGYDLDDSGGWISVPLYPVLENGDLCMPIFELEDFWNFDNGNIIENEHDLTGFIIVP